MIDGVDEEIRELRSRFWSERDPEGRAFAPLADACRRAGELDEALELLEDGLDRLPGFVPGHVVAGWVHRDRGDASAARDSFARVLDLDSENLAALRGLGEIADEEGDREEALERYRQLYALDSGDEALADRIAALQEDPGRDLPKPQEPEAESMGFREPVEEPLLREEPTLAEEGEASEDVVTATMAELYARQGLPEKAAGVYRRLLEQDPENEAHRARLRELEAKASEGPTDAEGPAGTEDPTIGTEGGDPIGRYFDVLLSWVPGAVPVESLAPDVVGEATAPATATAPGTGVDTAADGRPIVPIESLAPDAGADEADAALGGAPADVDVVPIESLAPDG